MERTRHLDRGCDNGPEAVVGLVRLICLPERCRVPPGRAVLVGRGPCLWSSRGEPLLSSSVTSARIRHPGSSRV